MPFISKDWRSPGEAWVKTDDGWERLKILECSSQRKRYNSDCSSSSDAEFDNNWESDSDGQQQQQESTTSPPPPPHCHITIKCTREIAGFNALGEAVRRLDFHAAVKDRKRFHYICALLRLLVASKGIASLPGSAQRLLLQMVEEVAYHVNDSQQNLNILRALVMQLKELINLEEKKCWGKPLGSTNLWQSHVQTINRIERIANGIRIRGPGPDVRPQLNEMPEECVREIVLRLRDYRDLEAASAAWQLMSALVAEQRVWRELSLSHFTRDQVDKYLEKKKLAQQVDQQRDWQQIYHGLRRWHGLKEDMQYAEVLALCRFCRCLFWQSLGHPCIADQCPEYRARLKEAAGDGLIESQPVPPAQFLKYFSL